MSLAVFTVQMILGLHVDGGSARGSAGEGERVRVVTLTVAENNHDWSKIYSSDLIL
jgi:hypothetical protein